MLGALGIRHAETIMIILAVALASVGLPAAAQVGGASDVSRNESTTPTPIPSLPSGRGTPEATETPTPDCPAGEFYDETMGRCWVSPAPARAEAGGPEPTWGAEIQATMDADLYDNDYQYIGWCFDYEDGGTRIRYYPCDEAAEATPPPE